MPRTSQADRSRTAWRLLLLLVAAPCLLFGYIDPGPGSFLIQALLAGVLGLSFTLKNVWRSLRTRLTRNADTQPKQP